MSLFVFGTNGAGKCRIYAQRAMWYCVKLAHLFLSKCTMLPVAESAEEHSGGQRENDSHWWWQGFGNQPV
jgi:hypothetical protein